MTEQPNNAPSSEEIEACIVFGSIWGRLVAEHGVTVKSASMASGMAVADIQAVLDMKRALRRKEASALFRYFALVGGPNYQVKLLPMFAAFRGDAIDAAMEKRDKHIDRTFAPLLVPGEIAGWVGGDTPTGVGDTGTGAVLSGKYKKFIGERCFSIAAAQLDATQIGAVKDGDILICNPSRLPEAGDLVLCRVDGQYVLGIAERAKGKWMLLASKGGAQEHGTEIEDESVWMRVVGVETVDAVQFMTVESGQRFSDIISDPQTRDAIRDHVLRLCGSIELFRVGGRRGNGE